MSKGQFEVEVICAQGLRFEAETTLGMCTTSTSHCASRPSQLLTNTLATHPGVYVKIYLKGKSKGNKRKTRIVQATDCPVFRQAIKYDGSLIDHKTLEVSVWLKQSGRRGKTPIGFTEIRPSELNLAILQTSWYNLRSMDSQQSSSIDD